MTRDDVFIPAKIYMDTRIPPRIKFFYGVLLRESGRLKVSYNTNKYYSEIFSNSERSVQNWFTLLVKTGYIRTTCSKASYGTVRKVEILGNYQ